jgi:3-dehydroquinate dehydratase/shikimate dehydrogenase
MQIMGIVGNPVSHSRSPAIHNAALAVYDLNAVYVPMLVDDLPYFLTAFGTPDYRGWSVTIPHKVCHKTYNSLVTL